MHDAERACFRAGCAADECHRAAEQELQAPLRALRSAMGQPEVGALEEYFPVEARRDGNLIVLKMSQPL
jgi:ferric-dicitrate binding protein FerR (iron transport regulator)